MTELQYWVSIGSPCLTFCLALLGWWFVYANTNRIAKRAEFFGLVSKAVDKVVALDRRCADYWLGDDESRDSPNPWIAGTLSELHGIRALLNLLEKHHKYMNKAAGLASLRSAATLSAEDIKRLAPEVISSQRLQQVNAVRDVINDLYDFYRRSHD